MRRRYAMRLRAADPEHTEPTMPIRTIVDLDHMTLRDVKEAVSKAIARHHPEYLVTMINDVRACGWKRRSSALL